MPTFYLHHIHIKEKQDINNGGWAIYFSLLILSTHFYCFIDIFSIFTNNNTTESCLIMLDDF